MKLIDDWRRKHAQRIAIEQAMFWSAVGGAIMIWPALADHVPLGFYVAGGVALSVGNGLAHFLKRPGAE